MLSPDTQLGYVHLTVADLERSLAFYQRSLGFRLHWQEENRAGLGAGKGDLLLLTEHPGSVKVRGRSGLYHFAILVPSRQELARSLRNIVETETRITGGSDHLVSEALYLDDPDGNGIEIYRDRPRSTWQTDNGQIRMAVDPLDYQGILNELRGNGDQNAGDLWARGDWTGLHPETVLGHMHLHVADLKNASAFYQEVIGFDLTAVMLGSAAFLSAGGYHHHLGINTWNGVGAPPPPPDSIGLRYFTIDLAEAQEQDALLRRLDEAGLAPLEYEEGLFIQDPSENGIVIRV